LRSNPEEWAEEIGERQLWEAALTYGFDIEDDASSDF
jgi:hypothetical protein